MPNNLAPSAYGQAKLGTLLNRWNSALGTAVRRMTPIVWPGVPAEAFIGFTAIAGGLTENTAESVNNPFAEIGAYQTEAGLQPGPYPNPDPNAPYNNWGKLANDPRVVQLLGRAASMVPDAWKQLPDDQAAVGLVNLRRYTDQLAAQIPASIRPTRYDTQWAVAMAFTAFSAGIGGARGLFTRYATQLTTVPEVDRWSRLLWLLARDIQNGFHPSGGAGRHGNVAYDALRTMQKFEAGRQLAVRTGGDAKWFDLGMGQWKDAQESVILAAAFSSTLPRFSEIAEPIARGGNLFFTAVAGSTLLYVAYRLWTRRNPIPTTIPARRAMPTIGDTEKTIRSAGRYRIMQLGAKAPCYKCRTETKTSSLSEERGEQGYVFTPVCPKHIGSLRAMYDDAGYVEHHRES